MIPILNNAKTESSNRVSVIPLLITASHTEQSVAGDGADHNVSFVLLFHEPIFGQPV